ncbi:hypothetical protein M408DRAFT_185378 [Serendipita vermifera MAFF 305830]|uniref:AP-2 complex subunit alpha n=1 Tax=Serendipita vermifera MAFF 305830 TaxID=933852 RepID=A0A0C2X3A6_SERVB|nr:hypothetical protein M408DRAFT_185378 [Serendipita vermifera MAFF 305830]
MASSMRGLTQFIADIRACRVKELEEKRINKEMANIRRQFKDPQLSSYQRKKYVSKLIFVYILGYKVDVGHFEAANLVTSNKYTEKQIGYLAMTLMLHEHSELLLMVVNSIKKDLEENNEYNNCLALHAIANVGSNEMAETLGPSVHRLLISPTSPNFVKKKAALTLLRLYRKYPEVLPVAEWAQRIVSIMDDEDLGVVVSVTSLVMAMAQDNLDAFSVCYQKAVDRLHKLIIDREYAATYSYYRIPTPWLQVKLLRLLQYYPPSMDPTVLDVLQKVIKAILNNSVEVASNVQQNNAQNAILFEAIGLAIHLDASSAMVTDAAELLARFISSKETNVRYLGLDTMAHLAARSDSLYSIKQHQATIINSLRDKDVSVRRRALDLLYSMCDTDNAEIIVGELLRYLKVADYGLREEMVLKIAISTEKFATSYKWYIDTILQLISSAGDHVGEEVWYRVVQITTNTDNLQEYASRAVFEHLRQPQCHESLVKVGGYILGEYGHLVANEPGLSPIEQFQALHSKSPYCSAPTRALLLTTYIKWVNVFPEIKDHLVNVFERYRYVLDAELQQRACEYYALATRPQEELLQQMCEEMPPFPPRGSALLNRLNKKHTDTEDGRVWIIGGKEANEDQFRKGRKATVDTNVTGANGAAATSGGGPDLMSLADLDLNGPTGLMAAKPVLNSSPSIDKWYEKLCMSNDGILYEDNAIQMGVKSEYHGHLGRIALYVGNKMSVPLTAFTASVTGYNPDAVSLTFAKIPSNTIHPKTQAQHVIHIESKKPFEGAPILMISYLAGSLTSINIQLPLLVTKFFEGVTLTQADFFERWKLIGGAPREAQVVFPITLDASGGVDLVKNKKILTGHGFSLLLDVDPNPLNLVGAGVLHTSAAGKVGCLLRLEPNKVAKLCRLTVRSTSEEVAAQVMQAMQKPLSKNSAL